MPKFRLMQGMHQGPDSCWTQQAKERVDELHSKERLTREENSELDGLMKHAQHTWRRGEIIDTNQDLLTLNGNGNMFPKFVKLDSNEQADTAAMVAATVQHASTEELLRDLARRGLDVTGIQAQTQARPVGGFDESQPVTGGAETPTKAALDKLDTMTVAQLKAFAEDNEIPLGTAKSKDELIKLLKSVYSV